MNDQTDTIQKQIHAARRSQKALRIEGNNSKPFIGHATDGEIISSQSHTGILSYDASELVIKVRSGTTLNEINAALAENKQRLPFEPPDFSGHATIGGTIACNISGPARAYKGAARDYLLGASIINGKAEVLEFGGQVMKNVAGYDASRLMAGAYGTLGFILDVSIKVLPTNHTEITVAIEQPVNDAIETINRFAGINLPINASCYVNDTLYIRLSSSEQNTLAACERICQQSGASVIDDSPSFWQSVREQQHDFFNNDSPLARVSVPATTTDLELAGEQFIEWGGALRWLKSDTDIEQLRDSVKKIGGHVTAYKNYPDSVDYFQPLEPGIKTLHQRLKKAFDPNGILNPGRMYKEF